LAEGLRRGKRLRDDVIDAEVKWGGRREGEWGGKGRIVKEEPGGRAGLQGWGKGAKAKKWSWRGGKLRGGRNERGWDGKSPVKFVFHLKTRYYYPLVVSRSVVLEGGYSEGKPHGEGGDFRRGQIGVIRI